MLPPFIRTYFWDTPIPHVATRRHARFIVERVMEHGDLRAARWLMRTYSAPVLRKVARESRRLSPKSRHYWLLILRDRTHQDVCTKRQSRHVWRHGLSAQYDVSASPYLIRGLHPRSRVRTGGDKAPPLR